MSTSVPPIQFTPAGVVLPSEAAVLAGVQEDYDAAFGGGLNPALSTPQGQLATSTTAIIAEKNSEIAYMANQVDPQYSAGRWQDGIGRIYFQTRLAERSTAVTCILGGLSGVVVPAGTFAQDTSGNTYGLLGTVTIGAGSTVSSSWQNVSAGPIPCPTETLMGVYQTIPGWDTITNPADGVLGRDVETPAEFELRRQNSVAINARGSTPSIKASVSGVANVLDCYVYDNASGNYVFYGSTNYMLAPHSLYVAVVGGTDADIAEAIWVKKDDGCSYNGNTSVIVYDEVNYSPPYPSYQVTFNRPTSTPVIFAVSLVNSPFLPSNIAALVKAAIVAQFNGTQTIAPARIGSAITGSNYYGAVIGVAPNITVLSILVGVSSPTLNQVVMGIDQAPVIDAGDITVTLV
jgi:Baseplate J-like protein